MMHGTINIKLTAYSCICWLFIEYIMMHGTINIKLTAYNCICWLFHRIYYDARNHKHNIGYVISKYTQICFMKETFYHKSLTGIFVSVSCSWALNLLHISARNTSNFLRPSTHSLLYMYPPQLHCLIKNL